MVPSLCCTLTSVASDRRPFKLLRTTTLTTVSREIGIMSSGSGTRHCPRSSASPRPTTRPPTDTVACRPCNQGETVPTTDSEASVTLCTRGRRAWASIDVASLSFTLPAWRSCWRTWFNSIASSNCSRVRLLCCSAPRTSPIESLRRSSASATAWVRFATSALCASIRRAVSAFAFFSKRWLMSAWISRESSSRSSARASCFTASLASVRTYSYACS
mmetsp:Transcript_69730/g.164046  ORF Transcript_69730/g.164046 Transcript_69730/m.164046 type:complete len:217 (-) Transcript_69730:383-1033(-)